MSNHNLVQQVMNLITSTYGHDPEDIAPDWDLMEEVGLFNSSLNNADDDTNFIAQINKKFDLEIDVQDISDPVKKGEIVTISDLADLIEDETLSI